MRDHWSLWGIFRLLRSKWLPTFSNTIYVLFMSWHLLVVSVRPLLCLFLARSLMLNVHIKWRQRSVTRLAASTWLRKIKQEFKREEELKIKSYVNQTVYSPQSWGHAACCRLLTVLAYETFSEHSTFYHHLTQNKMSPKCNSFKHFTVHSCSVLMWLEKKTEQWKIWSIPGK